MSDLVAATRIWIEKIRREGEDKSEKVEIDRHDGLGVAIPEDLIIGVIDVG